MKNNFKYQLRYKILIFAVLYSAVFLFFRTSEYFNYRVFKAEIDSIPWLYSTIGLIFGVISA